MSTPNPSGGEGGGWRKLAALLVAAGVLACLIVFRGRLGADFWPPDSSRVGPNLIASALTWAALFTVAVLLYPPWRRRLHRFVDRKLAPLHSSHEQIHTELRHLRESHEQIHHKLDALTPPEETKP